MASMVLAIGGVCARAQGALLLEEPYGWFGVLDPTGHVAIYLERICAETEVKLRPCKAGELGAVIDRHLGNGGRDWIATPLLPYLYSVEDSSLVPSRVDNSRVKQLRSDYRKSRPASQGVLHAESKGFSKSWSEETGVSYIRRIYVFRFETTPAQDEALIEVLNSGENRVHFNLFYRNCTDFVRDVLNTYFPQTFRRGYFLDAGISTPKRLIHEFVRFARKHPELNLTVFEIPQIPGFSRMSHSNHAVAESFFITGLAIPITFLNPYITGGLLANHLLWSLSSTVPKYHQVLGPESLSALMTLDPLSGTSEEAEAVNTAVEGGVQPEAEVASNSVLKKTGVTEE